MAGAVEAFCRARVRRSSILAKLWREWIAVRWPFVRTSSRFMVSSMDVFRAARSSARVKLMGTSSGRSMLEM